MPVRRLPEGLDPLIYVRALPLYARNLGVIAAPLVAAVIALGIAWLNGPLFDPIGGAGAGITGIIVNLIQGFAFGIALIFADDAWRHGRGNLVAAWEQARQRAGNILIAALGFYFLLFVARLIGSLIPVPFFGEALEAAALWAFIYSIPAAALGGTPGGAAFSASLQLAKRHPFSTTLLVIVSLVVYFGLNGYLLPAISPLLGTAAFDVAQILLQAIAFGYVAIVVAKQYADFSFRPYW